VSVISRSYAAWSDQPRPMTAAAQPS
jgi:hypothetical protein